MSASDGADTPTAWQPLTFGGVAAFAGTRTRRVLVMEIAMAFIAAGCVVWFLHRAYCPVILQAIQKMPDTARVVSGQLQGVPESVMAESKFLAIATMPQSSAEIGQGADLQIRLRQDDFCAGSIFKPDWGLDFPYQRGVTINLGRSALEPWWSAWKPVLLIGAGLGTVLFLLASWILLATLYTAPAKFIALFADRHLTWVGAWRLASAALMPGAVLLTGAIILYAWSVIDLVGLSFFFVIHFLVGCAYMIGGACKAPPAPTDLPKRNPFIT